jgi:hypothetical protein
MVRDRARRIGRRVDGADARIAVKCKALPNGHPLRNFLSVLHRNTTQSS